MCARVPSLGASMFRGLVSVFGGHIEVAEVDVPRLPDAFHLPATLLMGLKKSFQRAVPV